MTIITFPVPDLQTRPRPLRPFDVRRDLDSVADLVERCFSGTLDADGRRYIRNMRSTARHPQFLRWAASVADRSPYPFSGYVWEADGAIVGNLSLIPMTENRRRIYLIANVAVDPEYRRRGIARALTEAALKKCRSRGASHVWLHVRKDNPGAIALYRGHGFVERTRRTSWHSKPEIPEAVPGPGLMIGPHLRRHWRDHRNWLAAAYPPELDWYTLLNRGQLRPGALGFLVRLLGGVRMRQWAVSRDGELQAVLTYQATASASDRLLLAAAPDAGEDAVRAILLYARRRLGSRKPLTLEVPEGHAAAAIEDSGFAPFHTLIWMQLEL